MRARLESYAAHCMRQFTLCESDAAGVSHLACLQTQLFVEQRGKPAEDELSAWGQVRPVTASALNPKP